jgi:NAD(P)-dependent dehydrogenase (short-subunit alcohol dehydrogenase family)
VNRVSEVIEAMAQAVPVRKVSLDDVEVTRLRELTGELMAAKPEAAAEYARFLGIKQRGLCLPEAELAHRLDGTTILVTGGTGCIGATLMAQLAQRRPARLVCVSRGVTAAWPRQASAEYLVGDVRDRARLDEIIARVRPDVIFHVAAQRSPALAEVEVHRTVSTNVLGSRNVLAAAAAAGVPQVVCASTGKALRPYSPEMYAASKRAAEWAASAAAASGELLVSAARFTHVLDNSIVYSRLLDWADAGAQADLQGAGPDPGTGESAVVRLHGSSIAFYVQSALESAQLLLIAYLGARPGEFRVHAITDLGWPVSLIDVALGVLASKQSRTPVYISGYDPGYEEVPFPGLYDPATAGDVSPLLNAFEAAALVDSPCPRVDAFELAMAENPVSAKLLGALASVCERTEDPVAVRGALDELSWSLLDAALAGACPTALNRSAKLICQHEERMTPVHRRVTEAIKSHACPPPEQAQPSVAPAQQPTQQTQIDIA